MSGGVTREEFTRLESRMRALERQVEAATTRPALDQIHDDLDFADLRLRIGKAIREVFAERDWKV
jgi:hypothetical protein